MANNGKLAIRGGNSNIHSIQSLINSVNGSSGQILAQGASGSNWTNNIFSFSEDEQKLPEELVRKYEIYESKEDLLALSCAWYRIRNTAIESKKPPLISVCKLLDRNLFSQVNEDDRVLAANIRDYYSKKIMMIKLKNERMTEYREDLNAFIHSDGKKFVEKMFGLAYRLPQFYFYDTKLDTIFSGRNKKVEKTIPNLYTKTLNYVGHTTVDRKALKRNEYWFADEDDTLVAVYLDIKNPLLGVWEKLIKNPINLTGSYYTKRRDETEFYALEKFN